MHPLSLFSIILYFLPTIIVLIRKHPRAISIALLNFFLGWTFVAWIIALVWSLAGVNFRKIKDTLIHNEKEINSQKHACKCYMEQLTAGEQRVADTLARELSFKDYFLFNNIILHSKNTASSQIDHIVVSKFGVFVIENKDYSGWIFGSEQQASWTQTFQNGEKFSFQNPLRQNYSHLAALKELIPALQNYFYSVVVFSGDAEIKTSMPPNVLLHTNLVTYIENFKEERLSEDDVQMIIGKLSYACQTINISVEEHVANIRLKKKTA